MPWRKVTYPSILDTKIAFLNEDTTAVIKELTINIKALKRGYEIVAKASNGDAYKKLIAETERLGLPRSNSADAIFDLLKIRINCNDLTPIAIFIQALKDVDSSLGEIKEDLNQALKIDLDRSYTLPSWVVSGYFDHGEVECINTSPTAIVKQLTLCDYGNRCYEFVVRASSRDAYKKLIAETKRFSLLRSDSEPLLRMRCNDLASLAIFILALKAADSGLVEINKELSNQLNIDLDSSYALPNWLVISFLHLGKVQCINTSPVARVKEFILYNNHDGEHKFVVHLTNREAYRKLVDNLKKLDFAEPCSSDAINLVFTETFNRRFLRTTDIGLRSGLLLDEFKTIEPQFSEIELYIMQELRRNIDIEILSEEISAFLNSRHSRSYFSNKPYNSLFFNASNQVGNSSFPFSSLEPVEDQLKF